MHRISARAPVGLRGRSAAGVNDVVAAGNENHRSRRHAGSLCRLTAVTETISRRRGSQISRNDAVNSGSARQSGIAGAGHLCALILVSLTIFLQV
jgi:hypothetical protein